MSSDYRRAYLRLKGLSTGGFREALEAICGPKAGLAMTNIVRLKEGWKTEYDPWAARARLIDNPSNLDS